MTVLERIIELRIARGWSEYKLAEESGIAQSTISSWFRKNVTPNIGSLENICKAFNITLSQFFSFNEEPFVLSNQQRELLDNWARLTHEQQELFLKLLKTL